MTSDYEKTIAKALLESLDDDFLWSLARALHGRGLVSPEEFLPGFSSRQVQQAAPHVAPEGTLPKAAKEQRSETETSKQTLSPEKGAETQLLSQQQPQQQASIEESTATSLILRNLPVDWNQEKCREWVDKHYKGLYDFLLWFPPKKMVRVANGSYAFINFVAAQHARRFKSDFHLLRFNTRETGEASQLSIAYAKIQGFSKNYIRFGHLLQESSHTHCSPYFDPTAMSKLSEEDRAAAERSGELWPGAQTFQEGPKIAPAAAAPQTSTTIATPANQNESRCTTVVIRNLPDGLSSQATAMELLDLAGFKGKYDFFLYVPPKRKRVVFSEEGGQTTKPGMGYAFVNFLTPEYAQDCLSAIHGKTAVEGDPSLNVVLSKIQGVEECMGHFNLLFNGGRLEPWVCPSRKGQLPKPEA